MLSFVLFHFIIQLASANIGGSDLQNFNPNTNSLEFITVQSSRTLEPGLINMGTFLSYSINSLPYSALSATPPNQKFSEPDDQLTYSHLQLGVGLMKGWDLGLSAGFILSQIIEDSPFLFSYGDTGINDIRLNSKVRFYQDELFGLSFMTTIDFDQIKDNPFTGTQAGPTLNFEAIGDWWITPEILWALNMGYRFRQPGLAVLNTGITPLPDQILYSSALSYKISDHGSAIIGEIYGSYPTDLYFTPTDRDNSNLEFLIGYRYRSPYDFDLHVGAGREVYHGLSTPDFRFFIGINGRIDYFSRQNRSLTD